MSRLGEFLLRRSAVSADQLRAAVAFARETGVGLAGSLVRLGLVGEQDLVDSLREQYRFPVVELTAVEADPEALATVSAGLARRLRIVPLRREGPTLVVATADPTDHAALTEIKFLTGASVRAALATVGAIDRALERLYPSPHLSASRGEHVPDPEDAATWTSPDAPVVPLVNAILEEAMRRGASDVHIEPYADELRVRFRVDGLLYEVLRPTTVLRAALTSRLKVMAGLDISERRLPQDGGMRIRLDGRTVSFRVSVLPTAFGEKVVLRLLDKANVPMDLARVGFDESGLAHVRRAIERPSGLVLVTGPTGSGKTTTLYALLAELNRSTRNISTAEDPIEIHLRGVNQVQVNEAIGLTFASALRSFLRQDPDVIMVGEIRDSPTAEIAVKAALTGHLVLSTLHTNDAPSAIDRLTQMSIEPYLISSSLALVLAQRLVRVLCPECKSPAGPLPAEIAREAGFGPEEAVRLSAYRSRGCGHCGGTGFRGRAAVYEALPVEDELREAIAGRASAGVLRRIALDFGMRPLRRSGLDKVLGGITSLEEVVRVTPD